jgi:hypothetical protein
MPPLNRTAYQNHSLQHITDRSAHWRTAARATLNSDVICSSLHLRSQFLLLRLIVAVPLLRFCTPKSKRMDIRLPSAHSKNIDPYPPPKVNGREQFCDCANRLLTFCETNSSLVKPMPACCWSARVIPGSVPGFRSGFYLSGVPDGFE